VINSTPSPVTPTVTPETSTIHSSTNSGIYNDFISLCKRAVPQ
jgi:hypothetical protein